MRFHRTTFAGHVLVLTLALFQAQAAIFDTPKYWSFAVKDSDYTTVRLYVTLMRIRLHKTMRIVFL